MKDLQNKSSNTNTKYQYPLIHILPVLYERIHFTGLSKELDNV